MNKVVLMMMVILGLTALTGCAGIKQPMAQMSLVAPSLQKTAPVPALIVEVLEDGRSNNLSAVFYSARGQFCRFLSVEITQQLYCQYASGVWFAVPAVLSDMQVLE
jgi:predicted small lipoprotein YifL